MKAKYFPQRDCYRFVVPARFSEHGKRKSVYAKTEEEAKAKIERILHSIDGFSPLFNDRFSKVLEIIQTRISDIQTIKIQANGDLVIEFQITKAGAE
jgi:hypothetical protein